MCTVALFLGLFPGAPLVVAANRDERLDRPATGPSLREGPVPLVAPRDELAGGTWWSVAPGGLVVAITNRFGVPVDPSRRSRGLLVEEVAASGSFEAAVARAAALDARDWNGFHLVVANGDRAVVVVGDGRELAVHERMEGLWVVSERSHGAATDSRDASVHAAFEPAIRASIRPDPTALLRVLSGHGEGFEGPCIHAPAIGYGTRSSAVIIPSGPHRALVHTEGPPCVSAPIDATTLLEGLPA